MSDKIQVAIKVRPRVPREENAVEVWKVVGDGVQLISTDGASTGCESYVFDHVFGKGATNFDVFERVVSPLVDRAVKGFNATIFAYGQTSSGKTHTMLGDNHEVGIIQLAVNSMFDFMTRSEGREFLVRASYMEIYNEKVNDLLDRQNTNLKIREDDGRIVVSRLKEELVADTAKVMSLLKRGQKLRRIGETNLNERSSRSHTIFRMIIESRLSGDGEDGTIQVSQLNLVDLAGSERAGLAGTTGDRLKEGCAINRSLFPLSQVVSQLSEGNQFVNFRDSKLTRILQPSLGGNAHILIICTITPVSLEFTQSTLGFALRAKSVKNKPLINEVMSDGKLLKKYARQLEKLQAELKAAKERNPSDELEAVESKLEEQERINSELQQRINALMKSLIVSKPKPKLRPNRRRTWGGGKAFDLLKPRFSTLGEDNPEDNLAPFDTSLVMETNDLSFNTPYEDFEVQLIEDEREKCDEIFNISRLDCSDMSRSTYSNT